MQAIRNVWDIHDLLREQYEVDKVYNQKAGVIASETFEKRKLALWVEVGELVNEWKELFKFWSNKKMDREKALEEYVDCLHFFLSLGNDLKVDLTHDLIARLEKPISQIFALSAAVSVIDSKRGFYEAFALLRGLGEHLEFTEREVVAAYFKKNDKNELRTDHI